MSLVNKTKKVRLLVMDEQPLNYHGIKSLLSTFQQIEVIGLVKSGLDACSSYRTYQPDVILIDLQLPGMRGIDVIKTILSRWPNTIFLCHTAIFEEYKIIEAMSAGAKGYILKTSSPSVILEALHSVLKNKRFIDPSVKLNAVTTTSLRQALRPSGLTPREIQILKLISEGFKNKQIADLLTISLKTVQTHRLNLMKKLEAHNAAQLVHWARRIGLH
ncbi:LuxR C-terminal-related transcriptional regulator [Vibrio sp. S4M6]|uniref:LuxR C-terminal-related transcriptional regulator n=1 Tax=Vibrio sinus TaxID=2946865 RepID=UPI002029F872|nr:LuxR C-terminal-related transcriptional regulator [Vibrio sinus]MCL9780667.1 LuxR C-terminal-related transcriptional regulator [Vibrio sinus]